jgi:hypothetical protein
LIQGSGVGRIDHGGSGGLVGLVDQLVIVEERGRRIDRDARLSPGSPGVCRLRRRTAGGGGLDRCGSSSRRGRRTPAPKVSGRRISIGAWPRVWSRRDRARSLGLVPCGEVVRVEEQFVSRHGPPVLPMEIRGPPPARGPSLGTAPVEVPPPRALELRRPDPRRGLGCSPQFDPCGPGVPSGCDGPRWTGRRCQRSGGTRPLQRPLRPVRQCLSTPPHRYLLNSHPTSTSGGLFMPS